MQTPTPKRGILLVNLGSPDSPTVRDVRKYLKEFLLDPKVIDVPAFLRHLIVRGFILPFRPKKSAEAYSEIWTKEGSPLIVTSYNVMRLLQARTQLPVALGMRYGNPSIQSGIDQLVNQHPDLEEIFLVPLYPHYALASFESVWHKARDLMAAHNTTLKLTTLAPFYKDPDYIHALSESIKPYVNEYEYFIFSYHGIPYRHLRKTDPTGAHCTKVENCCLKKSEAHTWCYRHQATITTKMVAKQLGLTQDRYAQTYQSRLEGDKWLSPYTDKVLEALPAQGKKSVAVVTPAFVSDCLETIEEIGIRGRDDFMAAGGEKFVQVPCLNENKLWIDALEKYTALGSQAAVI